MTKEQIIDQTYLSLFFYDNEFLNHTKNHKSIKKSK